MKRLLVPFVAALSPAFILILGTQTSQADSATWKTNPSSGDWNNAANWTPPTIPNGPSDTATFAASNTTGVSLSANTEVNGIVFNVGASAFTITVTPSILTISGVGITNNSGIAQNFATTSTGQFLTGGQIIFTNSAAAGSLTMFTNNGGALSFFIGGVMTFLGSSTADHGTFTNNGGTVPQAGGGWIGFGDTSTAGNGTFINNGGAVSGAFGGITFFQQSSTAGNGTFTNNGNAGATGGQTEFRDTSTAGHATLIANAGLSGGPGGFIRFIDDSTGGTARVEVFGNGFLDISGHNAPGVATGSIEGDGLVFLGSNNVSVGSNHRDTTFSGVIQGSGTLTKIGSGKLVLKHRNTYSGGTTVKRGKLIVNNTGGSGTGSGPVQVDGGWLGGKGIIAGAVTVGAGTGSGAVLAPGYVHGVGSPGALTIQSALTFSVDATYDVDVNSSIATADKVIANGVTINNGAQFSFSDIGTGTLTLGTVFTVIDNTAATPIAGTFSNLPDGSTFTSNGNTYQVSYEGGDGNDLTLTVVP